MFVTFEGVDGAGKSTQARLLAEALGEQALLLREPGGTEAGERLRDLLKDPEVDLGARAELLLFCAARAELVERVIAPALREGRTVICDRFGDSSVAYQGAGRGLGVEVVRRLNDFAVAGCAPARTVLLRLPVATAAARGTRRGGFGADRFEGEGVAFQESIAACLDGLAASEPDRWRVVDGTGEAGAVHERVLGALELGS